MLRIGSTLAFAALITFGGSSAIAGPRGGSPRANPGRRSAPKLPSPTVTAPKISQLAQGASCSPGGKVSVKGTSLGNSGTLRLIGFFPDRYTELKVSSWKNDGVAATVPELTGVVDIRRFTVGKPYVAPKPPKKRAPVTVIKPKPTRSKKRRAQ